MLLMFKVFVVGWGMFVNELYIVIDYKFEIYIFVLFFYSVVFVLFCIFYSIFN